MAVNATAIWRVRPSGNNNNGGGYDPGIASAGTDYSQSNTPILSQTSTANTSTATVTLTDTGASFTSALIGNAIKVSGTGISTVYTFITGVPSGTTLTLQTSPGATGTAVSYNIGGGWADFWTNTVGGGAPVAGNIVYILGSGIPNPASYTYDYTMTTYFTPIAGLRFYGDPSTPSYIAPPDTTGGMPVIRTSGGLAFYNGSAHDYRGIWIAQNGTNAAYGAIYAGGPIVVLGCVYDQRGFDQSFIVNSIGPGQILGCEMFSSVVPGAPGTQVILGSANKYLDYCTVNNCNIHDTVGPGCAISANTHYYNNIISKCRGDGIAIKTNVPFAIINNTIDGNAGHGIYCSAYTAANTSTIINNIISNHTVAGKYGINLVGLTDVMMTQNVIDYNVFYNNTSDVSPLSYGPHDTHGGSDPFTAQSTEDYTLA